MRRSKGSSFSIICTTRMGHARCVCVAETKAEAAHLRKRYPADNSDIVYVIAHFRPDPNSL